MKSAALLAALLAVGAAGTPPNILLMFADDQGWGDVGANWRPTVETPNIDALAARGLRFTDFHAGASVCTPSRAAIQTGRLGLRTGVTENFGPSSVGGLPLNETTLGELLKGAGYATGMLGKWHLGKGVPSPLDDDAGPYWPTRRGYDEFFGLPLSNDYGCADTPGFNLPMCDACPVDVDERGYETAGTCSNYNMSIPLFVGDDIVEQPVNLTSLSSRYAAFATDFIERHSAQEQPWFLVAAFTHMHVPLAFMPAFAANTTRGPFGAALAELDDTVGRILQAAQAVANDTLVIYAADNGGWSAKCALAGHSGPWAGLYAQAAGGSSGKFTTFEGGHRVPAIFSWPGRVSANATTDALGSLLDLFPTLAAVAGASPPADRVYDGRDLSPVLFDGADAHHAWLPHPNSGACGDDGAVDTVRVGPHKVFWRTGGSKAQACGGQTAPCVEHDPPLVFDLARDPAEAVPLPAGPLRDRVIANATALREELLQSVAADRTRTRRRARAATSITWCVGARGSPVVQRSTVCR